MKHLLLSFALLCSLSAIQAQTITRDKQGNYIAVHKDTAHTLTTGHTYTDTKGNTYQVYISKTGKLFVNRVSKAGNNYKQYLKIN